jgi:hypothetical protein
MRRNKRTGIDVPNDDKRDVDLFLSHGDEEVVGSRSNEAITITMRIGSIEKVCVVWRRAEDGW